MKKMRVPKAVLAAGVATGVALMAFRPRPTDETPLQRIARQVSDYYAAARGEKAYLHLDRPVYATGETIWFSAYVVDASQHRLDSLSQVLHVDLVSAQHQVVARRTLQLRGGRAYGDLDIADSLAAGTYVLRAYTNWMRNAGDQFVYSRRLNVWPASPLSPPDVPQAAAATGSKGKAAAASANRPDVQFFPEGGYLVEGLPAVVACKATDATGRGLDVRGQILDAQNKVVLAAFSSRHGGMGRFAFVPGTGQRYHARVTLPDGSTADYPLPAVQPSGYTLHVVENATEFLVEARYRGAAGAPAPGPIQLMTQVRGVVAYPGPRPVSPEAPATWRMPKKNYPTGIVHFTLFDAQGAPQCERLAFVQNGAPGLKITLTPDQPSYGPHAPVQLNVRVTDAAGQPVATNFSVAVSDAALSALDPNAETIASNLLLTSDLTGYVENPGYYFRNQSAATAQALDDLLLTQGWRRFVWKEVLAGQKPPLTFSPETALSLTGQVVSQNGNRPIPNSQLTFLQTRPERNIITATTDAQGRFSFIGIPVRDTAVITLQARRAQGGTNVLIKPDTGPPTGNQPLPQLPQLSAAPAAVATFVRRSRQAQAAELDLHPEKAIRNINLGNVSVTAKRAAVPRDDPRRMYGATGGTVIDFANDPTANSSLNILQFLQGRVAGLTISGSPPNMSAQIRGGGTPLFILDGIKVDIDAITNLNTSDVEAVEVFKGAEAAIFGSSGGAIAVYTKRANPNYKGPDNNPAPGIATVKLPGFYAAREFYQPRYNALLTNPPADPRTSTLYWNPTVRTNANGQAELHFFTADGGGTFQAVAEGVSLEGMPALGSGTMVVRGK
ncbi:TonB-dependent receptor plug domain-containing protein [Hymenobacter armeniacus]|uniref:TonB-dependent receptor plug domain-containing protein n=1 Tax=Hymenobacter armeniacus TaxID=2771358 RepID=A0ABR8JX23_9BACT|nr:TonB-dependent receptor plug domain-containing protein [Hymenobacter armeniacus]MBD2724500.1 TonB-dependent receptor plug domain-containing protein [Hymenobacter armeniacus]